MGLRSDLRLRAHQRGLYDLSRRGLRSLFHHLSGRRMKRCLPHRVLKTRSFAPKRSLPQKTGEKTSVGNAIFPAHFFSCACTLINKKARVRRVSSFLFRVDPSHSDGFPVFPGIRDRGGIQLSVFLPAVLSGGKPFSGQLAPAGFCRCSPAP